MLYFFEASVTVTDPLKTVTDAFSPLPSRTTFVYTSVTGHGSVTGDGIPLPVTDPSPTDPSLPVTDP